MYKSLPDGSFNKLMTFYDAIYFSTITHTTLGYGVFYPESKTAKFLSAIQYVFLDYGRIYSVIIMKVDVILLNVSINLLLLAIVQTIFFFSYIKDMVANATLVPIKDVIDDYNHCSLLIPRDNNYYFEIYENIINNVDETKANEAKQQRAKVNNKLFSQMVTINAILFAIALVLTVVTFYRKNITTKEFITSLGFVLAGFSTEFIFFFTVASQYQYITGIEVMSRIFERWNSYNKKTVDINESIRAKRAKDRTN